MTSQKKIGWKQLSFSAIAYAVLAAIGYALVVAFPESLLVLIGALGGTAATVAMLVHIVAAGIRLADADRVLAEASTPRPE